jgi:hypothetical protein
MRHGRRLGVVRLGHDGRREDVGMPWAWMAIIEIAFSDDTEPTIDSTLARGKPKLPRRAISTSTRSPSLAPPL